MRCCWCFEFRVQYRLRFPTPGCGISGKFPPLLAVTLCCVNQSIQHLAPAHAACDHSQSRTRLLCLLLWPVDLTPLYCCMRRKMDDTRSYKEGPRLPTAVSRNRSGAVCTSLISASYATTVQRSTLLLRENHEAQQQQVVVPPLLSRTHAFQILRARKCRRLKHEPVVLSASRHEKLLYTP